MASSRRLRYRLIIAAVTLIAVVFGMVVIQAQQDGQPLLGVRTVVTQQGTQVVEVLSGSPAAWAGFRVGDLIIAINEDVITSSNPLEAALSKYRPGTQIQITILRSGTQITLTATLGSRAALETATSTGPLSTTKGSAGTPQVATVGPATPAASGGFLGVRVTNTANAGARVTSVLPGSPADAAGIRAGDVILVIDDRAITTADQVQTLINGKTPGDTVMIRLRRGDTLITVTVKLAPRPPEEAQPGTPFAVTAQPLPPAPGGVSMSFQNLGFLAMLDPVGLRVIEVTPNGPARIGGLMVGDVVTAVDDVRYNARDVTPIVTRLLTAPRVRLVVLRGGQQTAVVLQGANVQPVGPSTAPGGRLGVTYDVVTPVIARDRGLSVDYGALVLAVAQNSPADIAGIRPGDVITAVDGDKVDTKRTLAFRMAPYSVGDTVMLTIVRGAETLQIPVTLASRGVAEAPVG